MLSTHTNMCHAVAVQGVCETSELLLEVGKVVSPHPLRAPCRGSHLAKVIQTNHDNDGSVRGRSKSKDGIRDFVELLMA